MGVGDKLAAVSVEGIARAPSCAVWLHGRPMGAPMVSRRPRCGREVDADIKGVLLCQTAKRFATLSKNFKA